MKRWAGLFFPKFYMQCGNEMTRKNMNSRSTVFVCAAMLTAVLTVVLAVRVDSGATRRLMMTPNYSPQFLTVNIHIRLLLCTCMHIKYGN